MSVETDGEQIDDRGGGRKTEELFVEHFDFMFATARKVLVSVRPVSRRLKARVPPADPASGRSRKFFERTRPYSAERTLLP